MATETKLFTIVFYDAPSENRTRVFSATTRCPNHWTMRAEIFIKLNEYKDKE